MVRIVKAPDERRSELMASAQHFFFTKGFDNTSINDIIKDVGVAKGTFYHYFDSKTAVMEAIVAELVEQAVDLMRTITEDDSLPVLEKWRRALQTVAKWKHARRDEMLEILKVMHSEGNIVFQHKITSETIPTVAPEFTKIIAQGVQEGVFNTEYVEDAAEIMLSIMQSSQAQLTDIFLYPEKYDEPAATVKRKYAALQTAVERVLGAQKGSVFLVDEAVIDAWFT